MKNNNCCVNLRFFTMAQKMEETKLKIRHLVRGKLNVVNSSESTEEELNEALRDLASLLPRCKEMRPRGCFTSLCSDTDENVKELFLKHNYQEVCG